ncbi:LysR family transcriptional regulator [Nocardia sp. NPDC003482]
MDPLRKLRYFVAVAEESHFGRAAERLGIAQPPLSQRIRELERDLGARLFDRGRTVTLTEAGQVLLAESRDLLARWDRTVALVGRAHRGETDALRVGVPPDLAGRTLAALLTAFERARPEVRLDLQELTTTEQLALLAERQLDAGLLEHPVDVTGLRLGPAIDTPLGVVLRRESPLASKTELALSDLAGHGLVMPPRAAAPGPYDAILRICWEQGFRPGRVVHARNPEFVLGLVLSGHGVAFEQGTVARKEARVVWRPLRDEPVRRRLSLAWPTAAPHPAASGFAELIVEVLGADGVSRPVPAGDDVRPWQVLVERR